MLGRASQEVIVVKNPPANVYIYNIYIYIYIYIYINNLVPLKYVQLLLQKNVAKYQKSFIGFLKLLSKLSVDQESFLERNVH